MLKREVLELTVIAVSSTRVAATLWTVSGLSKEDPRVALVDVSWWSPDRPAVPC